MLKIFWVFLFSSAQCFCLSLGEVTLAFSTISIFLSFGGQVGTHSFDLSDTGMFLSETVPVILVVLETLYFLISSCFLHMHTHHLGPFYTFYQQEFHTACPACPLDTGLDVRGVSGRLSMPSTLSLRDCLL